MALAFVPILAQVLAIGVGDRTELRYRVEPSPGARAAGVREDAVEAETRPYVAAELSGPKSALGVAYSPSFLYGPLEDEPVFTILHGVSGHARLELSSRHTTVTFEERGEYLQQSLTLQALSAPRVDPTTPAPDMMPGGGPTGGGSSPDAGATPEVTVNERASRDTLQSGSARSSVTLSQRISRKVTFGASAGYGIRGGLDEASRDVYPVEYGPDAGVSLGYVAGHRDTLTTTANGQLVMTPKGQRSWSVGAEQGLTHRFNRRTVGDARAGAAYTLTELPDAPDSDGVYPTGGAGLAYETRLKGGIFTVRLRTGVSPVVDRSTTLFDPRLESTGDLSYSRRRVTVFVGASSAVSLDPDSPQALNSYGFTAGLSHQLTLRLSWYTYVGGGFSARPNETQRLSSVGGGAGAAYDLGAGFAADTGVRGAYERFETEEIVPATFAAFIALSWNGSLLNSQESRRSRGSRGRELASPAPKL